MFINNWCKRKIILPEFKGFKKIPRLDRRIIITEKIDGTNGVIYINEDNDIFAGSKNRWLDKHNENHGFWHWVMDNKEELLKLGIGYHYGEFWGKSIQRNYGLNEKRFSLFNTSKWVDSKLSQFLKEKQEFCPKCCYIVPILYEGIFNSCIIKSILNELQIKGSYASPGFMKPEGIIIYHKAGGYWFKKTIENDEGKYEKN